MEPHLSFCGQCNKPLLHCSCAERVRVIREALTGRQGVAFYDPSGKLRIISPMPRCLAPPGHTIEFLGTTFTARHTWGLGSGDVVPTMWGVPNQGGK